MLQIRAPIPFSPFPFTSGSSSHPISLVPREKNVSSSCSKDNNNNKKVKPKSMRPPNAFMLFSQENRSLVQADFPGVSNTEISKKLGERWHALHPLKKDSYREKAESIKVEMQKSGQPYNLLVKQTPKPTKTPKNPRTKRPRTQEKLDSSKKQKVVVVEDESEGSQSPSQQFTPESQGSPDSSFSMTPEFSPELILPLDCEFNMADDGCFIQALIDANQAFNFLAPSDDWLFQDV